MSARVKHDHESTTAQDARALRAFAREQREYRAQMAYWEESRRVLNRLLDLDLTDYNVSLPADLIESIARLRLVNEEYEAAAEAKKTGDIADDEANWGGNRA